MPLTKEETKKLILDELRSQFTYLSAATDGDVEKLLGHRDIRPTYDRIKARVNGENAVPDDFASAGITPDMWAHVATVRESRNTARVAHAAESKRLAEEYDKAVKRLNMQLDTQLQATESPIVQIIELGADNLSAQVLFKLNQITDKKQRALKLNEALVELRKYHIRRAYGDVGFSSQNEAGRELID